MKILLITTTTETVINFRKELILFLKNKGHDVYVISSDRKYEKEIRKMCSDFLCVPFSNRSKNVFSLLKIKKHIKTYVKFINPDITISFQLKPNIIGPIAASSAGCHNNYSMVEGLGDSFMTKGLKGFFIKEFVSLCYKFSFLKTKKVFFLNNDDLSYFIKKNILKQSKSVVIHGIGIDINKFNLTPLPKEKKVLMISRLLINKGVIDYCEVARILKHTNPSMTFLLIGSELELTINNISPYIIDNSIQYLGHIDNVKKIIEESSFLVLPSYREGFPRSLLEGMAMGRPAIAYNCVGCRDIIKDKYNGILCKIHDKKQLQESIKELFFNDEMILNMGNNARADVVNFYSSEKINNEIYDIITRK